MTDEIIKGKIAKLWKKFAETKGYEWDKKSKMHYIRGPHSIDMLGDIMYAFREIIGDDNCCDAIYGLVRDVESTPGQGFIHTIKDGEDFWDYGYCEMEMEGAVDNTRCYCTKHVGEKLAYEVSITLSPASHNYKIRFIGSDEEKEISFDR